MYLMKSQFLMIQTVLLCLNTRFLYGNSEGPKEAPASREAVDDAMLVCSVAIVVFV